MQIWTEGYSVTGNREEAIYHGDWPGETFREAVENWMKTLESPELVNLEKMTYWGCRLFSDEKEARKTFG